jgi:hypothetical protein
VIQRNKAAQEVTREELFTNIKGNRIGKRGVQDIVKKYAHLTDERIESEGIDCPVNYGKNSKCAYTQTHRFKPLC